MNKDLILHHINLLNDNLRRLDTLVQADMADMKTGVPQYCCQMIINHATAINNELNTIEVKPLQIADTISAVLNKSNALTFTCEKCGLVKNQANQYDERDCGICDDCHMDSNNEEQNETK